MKWLVIFVVLVGVVIALPFVWIGITGKTLSDADRAASAPGKTVSIEDGTLHYVVRGPDDGPPVVMVHGFSTPHFIYEQNAQALADQGYRVYQFDHFGRGWSDRPKGPYDTAFYDREVLQFLDALGLTEPVRLVGLSMGGVISAEFVANHPDRVSQLFLVVSAGIATSTSSDSLSHKVLMTPLIGDWVWQVFGKSILTGQMDDVDQLPEAKRLQGDLEIQMQYRGYFPALLSTYRHMPMQGRAETFQRAAATGTPIKAVFGDADTVVPISSAERLKAVAPSITVNVIEGGTHGLNYMRYDEMNPMLLSFFRGEP